jgi:DNA recombination protein RmuC
MNEALTVVLVLLAAVLAWLVARSRSAAQLAEVRSEGEAVVAGQRLENERLRGQLQATEQQVLALTASAESGVALDQRLAPLTTVLAQLQEQSAKAERSRATSEEAFRQQLAQQQLQTREATEEVRKEASKLVGVLSRTTRRGHWGEAELRRLVEAAGMVERVHFTTQMTVAGDGGERGRPDMVVHLPGDQHIVVDSKAPLDALMEAMAQDGDYTHETMARLAAALRSHVDELAKRGYAGKVDGAVIQVVLYLPAESLLHMALQADPALFDHALTKQVSIVTPTTMLALLRTVAQHWRDQQLAEQAQEIVRLGTELHDRLATMSGHLAKTGRSLTQAVESYNRTVSSYEQRVLPSTRRFSAYGLTRKAEVVEPAQVEAKVQEPKVIDVTDLRGGEGRGASQGQVAG